jgi:hypothetical protein
MNKGDINKVAPLVTAMSNSGCINFGEIYDLRKISLAMSEVTKEYEGLMTIKAKDKEDGLQKFLDEPFEFTPLHFKFFRLVGHEKTALQFVDDKGKPDGPFLSESEVLDLLLHYKVIQ